jgi:ribosomal protein S18 acetylase RimI-like enzyme
MTPRTIRPAGAADYSAFVRLFPELEVDDPPTPLENFIRDVMPTMLVAEAGEGTAEPDRAVGYTHFQVIEDLTYVRHIVTAPEARRTGVGRALLAAVASRARAAGCSAWCLNVKRENTAAIALYEALGMARAFDSKALHLDWANADIASLDVHNTRISARPIEADDDGRVEAAMGLMSGQLATARGRTERVLVGLFEARARVPPPPRDPVARSLGRSHPRGERRSARDRRGAHRRRREGGPRHRPHEGRATASMRLIATLARPQ